MIKPRTETLLASLPCDICNTPQREPAKRSRLHPQHCQLFLSCFFRRLLKTRFGGRSEMPLCNAPMYRTAMSKLQAGDSGAYGELVRRALPENLSLVFVPSLAALLLRAQQLNGAALTEDQVLGI